jgi:hypothetical protein
MAGIGWVFGYGIVTPVFSARAGVASSRRVLLRRLGGHRRDSMSLSLPSSPGGVGARHAIAYAAVTSPEVVAIL